MAITIENLDRATQELFENQPIQIPPISVQLMDHIQAYKEANLKFPESELFFSARCQQAKAAGFQQLEPTDIVRMLTGDNKTKIKETFDSSHRVHIEWFYDQLFDRSFTSQQYNPIVYKPAFFSKAIWEPIYMVPLGYLKCTIPYGVLLRIAELKKLNLFNCFFAFAPQELVKTEEFIPVPRFDPVITAAIVTGHTVWQNGVLVHGVKMVHFFVAKW